MKKLAKITSMMLSLSILFPVNLINAEEKSTENESKTLEAYVERFQDLTGNVVKEVEDISLNTYVTEESFEFYYEDKQGKINRLVSDEYITIIYNEFEEEIGRIGIRDEIILNNDLTNSRSSLLLFSSNYNKWSPFTEVYRGQLQISWVTQVTVSATVDLIVTLLTAGLNKKVEWVVGFSSGLLTSWAIDAYNNNLKTYWFKQEVSSNQVCFLLQRQRNSVYRNSSYTNHYTSTGYIETWLRYPDWADSYECRDIYNHGYN